MPKQKQEYRPDPNYVMMSMWSIMAFVHSLKAGPPKIPISDEEMAATAKQIEDKVRAVWNELVKGNSKKADQAGSIQLCKECLQYCIRVLEE